MKTLLVFAFIGSLVPLARAETLAERAASLVARADSAGIRGELEKKKRKSSSAIRNGFVTLAKSLPNRGSQNPSYAFAPAGERLPSTRTANLLFRSPQFTGISSVFILKKTLEIFRSMKPDGKQ
jgi:hypothetical protein